MASGAGTRPQAPTPSAPKTSSTPPLSTPKTPPSSTVTVPHYSYHFLLRTTGSKRRPGKPPSSTSPPRARRDTCRKQPSTCSCKPGASKRSPRSMLKQNCNLRIRISGCRSSRRMRWLGIWRESGFLVRRVGRVGGGVGGPVLFGFLERSGRD